MTCVSATIASTKANGTFWDPSGISLLSRNPDPYCKLTTSGRTRSTPVINDTLMPTWNASVTPTTGGALTSSLLTGASGSWNITVLDQDSPGGAGDETICTVSQLTAADLQTGKATFTSVASCTQLNLSLVCAQPAAGFGP